MRQFLALDLSAQARAELARVQALLARTLRGWRHVDPAGMHLTLRFLGEVGATRDRALRGVFRDAVREFAPVRFRLEGAGVFPSAARPRVLWIGVREDPPAGSLEGLARALERAARAQGFPPEERRFRPHLTLARAGREHPAEAPREPIHVLDAVSESAEVLLLRSELTPAGAHYTLLETFPLAGPGHA